jgi:hypothetical protein
VSGAAGPPDRVIGWPWPGGSVAGSSGGGVTFRGRIAAFATRPGCTKAGQRRRSQMIRLDAQGGVIRGKDFAMG